MTLGTPSGENGVSLQAVRPQGRATGHTNGRKLSWPELGTWSTMLPKAFGLDRVNWKSPEFIRGEA